MTETTDEQTNQTGTDEGVEEAVEPEIVEEELDELEQLRSERDEHLDQLLRSRAEFLNFKRRTDQERFALRELVGRDVLSQFLPIVDDFERALGALPDAERANSWVSGMEMIQNKLNVILDRAGVKKVDALNKPFDPKEHEAVASEPGTAGSHVVEVYQSGYRIGDSLLRPAMVKTGDPVENDSSFSA
ncbi:MAG: nucleotide exchange factor GrpE [Thermomicrobiales bacterium]